MTEVVSTITQETDKAAILSHPQVISRTVRGDQSWIISDGTPPAEASETKAESPSGGLRLPKADSASLESRIPALDSPSGDIHPKSPTSGKVTSDPPVVPTPASGLQGTTPLPVVTLPTLATPASA